MVLLYSPLVPIVHQTIIICPCKRGFISCPLFHTQCYYYYSCLRFLDCFGKFSFITQCGRAASKSSVRLVAFSSPSSSRARAELEGYPSSSSPRRLGHLMSCPAFPLFSLFRLFRCPNYVLNLEGMTDDVFVSISGDDIHLCQ